MKVKRNEPVDVAALLQNLHPNAKEVELGRHRAIRFSTVTPAHSFEGVVVSVSDGRLVELVARDSFDPRLAEFVLNQSAESKLPGLRAKAIRVVAVEFPNPWSFDTLVIAPPAVARRFEHESKELARKTYWVVLAFEDEFVDLANGAAFWHKIYRKDGWQSIVVRRDRSRKTQPVYDA